MLDSLGHPDGLLDPSLSCYWIVALSLLPFLELGWVSFQNCLQGRPYSIVGCWPFTLLLRVRLRTLPGVAARIPVTHTLDLAGSLTPCPVSLTVIR